LSLYCLRLLSQLLSLYCLLHQGQFCCHLHCQTPRSAKLALALLHLPAPEPRPMLLTCL
jgi:hypothetical protein